MLEGRAFKIWASGITIKRQNHGSAACKTLHPKQLVAERTEPDSRDTSMHVLRVLTLHVNVLTTAEAELETQISLTHSFGDGQAFVN